MSIHFQFWKRKGRGRDKNSTYRRAKHSTNLVSDDSLPEKKSWKKENSGDDSLEGVKSFLDSEKPKTQKTDSLWKDEDWDYLLKTNQVLKKDLQRAKKERKQRSRNNSLSKVPI